MFSDGADAGSDESVHDIIEKLPPYLRVAPPCAGESGPSQRAFCLKDEQYPQ